MARSLKIPSYLQPRDSYYCGHVSVQMVLAYHGINKTLSGLVMEIWETDMCSLGNYLTDAGLRPVIYLDPGCGAESKNAGYIKNKPIFIAKGGILVNRSVTADDIEKAISDYCPVILNVLGIGNGHYVVVRGIGRHFMLYNDPWTGTMTGRAEEMIKSCHSWTGGAIIVKRN